MHNRTTDDLVRIALAGGGFEIDASSRTTDEIVRIASATGNRPSKLKVSNTGKKTTDDLVRIALAGIGSVFIAP